MSLMAITWGTLAAAGFAGLGLGLGIVIGVSVLRWVRVESGGGRRNNRAHLPTIDDTDPPA